MSVYVSVVETCSWKDRGWRAGYEKGRQLKVQSTIVYLSILRSFFPFTLLWGSWLLQGTKYAEPASHGSTTTEVPLPYVSHAKENASKLLIEWWKLSRTGWLLDYGDTNFFGARPSRCITLHLEVVLWLNAQYGTAEHHTLLERSCDDSEESGHQLDEYLLCEERP